MNDKGEGKKQLLVLMAVLAVIAFVTTTAAATTFLGLTDTPAAYSGAGGEYVRVNAGETALEFVAGGIDFGDYIDLPEAAEPASPAADNLRLFSLDDNGFSILAFKDSGGMVRKFVKDTVFIGYNNSGSTIAAARIVYASGSTGNVPEISLAKADSSTTMPAVGVTIETIANGAYGRIMQTGILEDVNTSSYSTGDILYVSATTAGIPTSTAPLSPNLRQEIGTILVDDPAVGSIQIVARTAFDDSLVPQSSATYILKAADATGGWTGADATITGNATDEWQTALNWMADNGGGTLLITEGTHTFSTVGVNYTGDNLTIRGMGEATLVDASAVLTNAINITGEVTATNSLLTANATAGQQNVTVADGGLFTEGDWVRIRSELYFDGGIFNKLAEIQRIESIAGNVLTMELDLADDYNTLDTATVDLLVMCEGITIENLRMVGAGSSLNQYGIEIRQAANVRINNVSMRDFWDRSLQLWDVVNANVVNSRFIRSNRSSLGYGVTLMFASRDITISNSHFESNRHGVAHGGGGGTPYGVQRNTVIDSNTFYGGLSNTSYQIDAHHSVDGSVWSNNVIQMADGFSPASRNILITGNQVRNMPDGTCVWIATTTSNVLILENDFIFGDYGVEMTRTSGYTSNITIQDNNLTSDGVSGTARAIYFTNPTAGLRVIGNDIEGGAIAIYLRAIDTAFEYTGPEISNNRIRGLTDQAILVDTRSGNMTALIIDSNTIYANGQDALLVNDNNDGTAFVNGLYVTNNKIFDANDAMDFYDYVADMVLTGNIIRNATRPIYVHVNNSNETTLVYMMNDWNESSANLTISGTLLTTSASTNIANDGTWYAGDDPG